MYDVGASEAVTLQNIHKTRKEDVKANAAV